jgi:hypothetical protein
MGKVNGVDSGLCTVAGFGMSGIKLSGFPAGVSSVC